MKELSMEEKAKAFDESLERGKIWQEHLYEVGDKDYADELNYIFPQLKENEKEDEESKKWILEYLYDGLRKSDEQFKDHFKTAIAWLENQDKTKEYTFKAIPRLLDMIEPTDRAKSYCQKLIDTLVKEGYNTDAKIVKECLKQMPSLSST